jgi:hypothetical protein
MRTSVPVGPLKSHVKTSVLPFGVVAVTVLGLQLGWELSLPKEGAARQDALASGVAWPVRLVSAGALSIASLLLVRGLLADRPLLRGRDDRVAGEYLGGGLLGMFVCVICGAFPGLLVATGVAAAVPWFRRNSADVQDAAGRDLRNAVFTVLVTHVLLVGVRETYGVYLAWDEGYGASAARVAAFRDDHGGQFVMPLALLLAVAASLLLPLALWRHRRRVTGGSPEGQLSLRALFMLVSVALIGLGFISANWPGAVVGAVCLVATVVLAVLNRRGPDS